MFPTLIKRYESLCVLNLSAGQRRRTVIRRDLTIGEQQQERTSAYSRSDKHSLQGAETGRGAVLDRRHNSNMAGWMSAGSAPSYVSRGGKNDSGMSIRSLVKVPVCPDSLGFAGVSR